MAWKGRFRVKIVGHAFVRGETSGDAPWPETKGFWGPVPEKDFVAMV